MPKSKKQESRATLLTKGKKIFSDWEWLLNDWKDIVQKSWRLYNKWKETLGKLKNTNDIKSKLELLSDWQELLETGKDIIQKWKNLSQKLKSLKKWK